MPFVKGDPNINRKGRPPGKIEGPWCKPDYWHNLILEQWSSLTPKEKAYIAMRGFITVMPRVETQSYGEFIGNLEAAREMLNYIQEMKRLGTDIRIDAGRPQIGMDGGGFEAQVIKTPNGGI